MTSGRPDYHSIVVSDTFATLAKQIEMLTALSNIETKTNNLDVASSTLATATKQDDAKTVLDSMDLELDTIRGVLNDVKAKTDNLDVASSTLATATKQDDMKTVLDDTVVRLKELAELTKKKGQALSFDGVDQYVEVPDDDSLDGILTFEAWMKPLSLQPDEGATYHVLVGKHDTYLHGLYVDDVDGATNSFMVRFNDGAGNSAARYYFAEVGVWYHVVGVYDNGYAKLYVNGELQDTGVEITGHIGDNDEPVRIAGGLADRYINAVVDDVRCYSRALSATEVAEHYNGVYTDESGLVLHLPLDGDVLDDSDEGNDGTAYNSPVYVTGTAGRSRFLYLEDMLDTLATAAKQDDMKTVLDNIKAKTDNLDVASSTLATAAKQDTMKAVLDDVAENAVNASDDLLLSHDDEEECIGSWTKIKEILILKTGRYRTKFDLRSDTGGVTMSARIYKNGSTHGTLRQTTSTDYTTYTEDLPFAEGDLCQLYVDTTSPPAKAYIRNFRLYGYTMVGIAVITL